MPRITQHQLARQLGVSRSTVAAALNPASTIQLRKETRQRVLSAARQLGYRPDRYARVVRGGRSGLIGILHFGGPFRSAAEHASHAAEAVRREGFEPVAADLFWSAEAERACASLLDARVEGVILAGLETATPSEAAGLERLRAEGVPVVVLGGHPFHSLSWAPHFRGDGRQGIRDLARHLLAAGHRRLALLACPGPGPGADCDPNLGPAPETGERRGFEEALREAGGALVADFSPRAGKTRGPRNALGAVFPVGLPEDASDPFLPGFAAMRRLLASRVRPTAVLCGADEIACGALRACDEAAVHVPRDVAITGCGDTAFGRYCGVPLTTLRPPAQAMAQAALKALLKLMADSRKAGQQADRPAPGARRPRLFPYELLLRASSGGPPPYPLP